MYQDQKIIKTDSIVEIITKDFLRLIGLVRYNKKNIISLADPCIINVKKIENKENNTVHFVTDMLPFRITGDNNFAMFKYKNLSNMSIVSSEKFINMWNANVNEFAKLYLHSK